MEKLIKEIEIESAEELFRELSVTGKYENLINRFIFRGQSDVRWELIPSIFREGKINDLFGESEINIAVNFKEFYNYRLFREQGLIYRFCKEADEKGLKVPNVKIVEKYKRNEYELIETEKNGGEKEWLGDVDMEELCALAQHYDIPTRLLDWTKDFYVALYFAVSNVFDKEIKKDDPKSQLALWAFNYQRIIQGNEEIRNDNENIIAKENKMAEENNSSVCPPGKKIEVYNEEMKKRNDFYDSKIFDETEATTSKYNSNFFIEEEFDIQNKKIFDYNWEIRMYNKKIEEDNVQKEKEGKEIKVLKKYKNFLIPIYSIIPPYYSNPNINAQKGILLYQKTCYGKENIEEYGMKLSKSIGEWENSEEYKALKLPLEKIVDRYINWENNDHLYKKEPLFYKFIIPLEEARNILEYLYKLGYDASKIFPGYYGVTKKIKEERKLKEIAFNKRIKKM